MKASQFLSSCSVDEEYTCFPHVSADRYFTSTEEPDVGVNDKLICEASAYANTPWVANALRLTLQHAEDDLMRVYQARSPSHNLTHTRRTDTQETAAEYANLRGHSCHLCTSSQTDGDTCGVHVCMAVLAILCDKEGEMQSFSGAAIHKHRRTILLCLVHGRRSKRLRAARRARQLGVGEGHHSSPRARS